MIQTVGFLRTLKETANVPSYDPPGETAAGMAEAFFFTLRRIPIVRVTPDVLSKRESPAAICPASHGLQRGCISILPLIHTLHSKPPLT